MKADGSLKSLLQGVSQQPAQDRLAGQCTEQINMSADPVNGLSRRSGTDLVGSLGAYTGAAYYSTVETKDGLTYLVRVQTDDVRAFTFNAVERGVTVTGSTSYLATEGQWSYTTTPDKAYYANNGVTVEMRVEKPTYANIGTGGFAQGILQVLGGLYAKEYTVRLDNTVIVRYKTVIGDSAGHVEFIRNSYIASVIEWLLSNDPSTALPGWITPGGGQEFYWTGAFKNTTNWEVSRVEEVVRIKAKNTSLAQFNLSVSDDAGSVNFKGMTVQVPDIADLPRIAPHGYAVRVAKETDPEEDLWLQFVVNVSTPVINANFGSNGAWYECLAPTVDKGFVLDTMPRVLTYDADTETFTFGQGAWMDRKVGTEVTNPQPSFVGNSIQALSTFQSRLVMTAGGNTITSVSKEYEDFWIGSASALVDTDPIDMSSTASRSHVLSSMIPHNKDLVIFSTKGQFMIFGRTSLTPSNAALVLTTSFEADLTADPVPSGRNVFFATKYGRYVGMREFYTEGGTDINDTRPITQHVKKYLKGSVAMLTSTSNFDMLLVHTDGDRSIVYPYQFIWSDQEKVQSAWSTWQYFGEVIYSFFDNELLYMVVRIGNEDFLLRGSLDIVEEGGFDFPVHLDAKFDVDGVNKQFVLPYDWLAEHDLTIMEGEGCPNPGLTLRVVSIEYDAGESGYVVTLNKDLLGGSVIAGIKFRSYYKPTMPRMKDQDGVTITGANLNINQFLVSIQKTAFITGRKTSKWGASGEVKFEGRIVNDVQNIIGAPALIDYIFKMPYKGQASDGEVEFYTDSPYPMTLLDIEWEGTVNKRGKRLSVGE